MTMTGLSSSNKKKRGSRSRTGCWTCRIRKVKCDEARPICRRCSSTGRGCDGYELQPVDVREVARKTERQLRAKTLQHSNVPPLGLSLRLDCSLHLSVAEARGFDFFRRSTSREAPGFFESDLWSSLILQLCHIEPAILHAAVAVGSLHSQYRGTSPSLQLQPFSIFEGQHAFAIRQYVKALGHLRHRLSSQDSSSNAEVALICCLLFMCLEMLQGNRVGVMAHLRTGLRVLSGIPSQINRNYEAGVTSLVVKDRADSLLDQLTTMFGRLDLESTTFGGERAPTLRLSLDSGMSESTLSVFSIPTMFSSTEEAKLYLNVLCNRALHVRGELLRRAAGEVGEDKGDWATHYCLEHATARTVDISRDPTLQGQLEKVQTDLSCWLTAFKSYAALRAEIQTTEVRSATLLEIQHFFIFFQVITCRQTTEVDCDRFNALFRRIVSLAAEIESTLGLTFTIEPGVIPSLYLIALKCRDPNIRRQAISLLYRRACQEGMWEGKLIAKFMDQVADWEETLAGTGTGTGTGPVSPITSSMQVPETSRFCDVTLAASEDPGRGRIICARYLHESSGELVVSERVFSIED
ncbi:hypothetical protein F5Y13DRAFT_165469 [Hypoxylon sp. FL1857]|nr:hypothetical protein F5Y13DRAFT_165469 [Hypoxylon sp. FL1857]